jgi:pimeloyl-ACP methyl ester carboxylesterase
VSCPEDTLHIAESEIDSTGVFGDYRVRQQIEACKAWNLPPRDVPRDFVRAKTPVLIVSGSMDAITPPEWSAHIAAHLPNARVVTFPLLGHFPAGLSHFDCYDAVVSQFFERGSAKDLDLSCIETMKPPPFALRGPGETGK